MVTLSVVSILSIIKFVLFGLFLFTHTIDVLNYPTALKWLSLIGFFESFSSNEEKKENNSNAEQNERAQIRSDSGSQYKF